MAYPNDSQFFTHGGNIGAAVAAFPNAPKPWVDLSTGISPWFYETKITCNDFAHLPQHSEIKELEQAAAQYYKCSEDEIIAVPGSDIAIRLLGQIFRAENKDIKLLTPIFSGHSKAFSYAKTISPENLEGLHNATVVFANPNNPDGRILTPEYISELIIKNNLNFIIDEAFGDVNPENSMITNPIENNIVLRSFGKFFGLAGLRLGFVIANPGIIAKLMEFLGDWQISSAAVKIGIEAYKDKIWHLAQRQHIRETNAKLINLFKEYDIEIVGNGMQFITIRHKNSRQLFMHLADNGILVRPFSYEYEWLRFGLPKDKSALDRLKKAFADFNWGRV